jgi:hypothetical protein
LACRRPAAAGRSGGGGPGALIVAYSLSRTIGLAPLEEHVEPVDAIGLLTQGVQAAGLVAALHLCHPSGGASARAARREPS